MAIAELGQPHRDQRTDPYEMVVVVLTLSAVIHNDRDYTRDGVAPLNEGSRSRAVAGRNSAIARLDQVPSGEFQPGDAKRVEFR